MTAIIFLSTFTRNRKNDITCNHFSSYLQNIPDLRQKEIIKKKVFMQTSQGIKKDFACSGRKRPRRSDDQMYLPLTRAKTESIVTTT
jgi:hypothetical protein